MNGCVLQLYLPFLLVGMKTGQSKNNLKTGSFFCLRFCATAKPHKSPLLVSIEMVLLLIWGKGPLPFFLVYINPEFPERLFDLLHPSCIEVNQGRGAAGSGETSREKIRIYLSEEQSRSGCVCHTCIFVNLNSTSSVCVCVPQHALAPKMSMWSHWNSSEWI